jgi:hypothetical protein
MQSIARSNDDFRKNALFNDIAVMDPASGTPFIMDMLMRSTYLSGYRKYLSPSRNDGLVILTKGVLHAPDQVAIFKKVAEYNDFNEEEDGPDHNMGLFDLDGCSYMFQIDAYDRVPAEALRSTDPRYKKVMTILKSDEY